MPDLLKNSDSVLVFGGIAKTGTTLPIALLDGHSEVAVIPEELRFFHGRLDRLSKEEAKRWVTLNPNLIALKQDKFDYSLDDYMEHGGTGFGSRDYSGFRWEVFEKIVQDNMDYCGKPEERFNLIVNAFKVASGQENKSIVACKAPNNEHYAKKWNAMLKERGRYVITTRIPTEHYISLNNIQAMMSLPPWDIYSYCQMIVDRQKKWGALPPDQTAIIDYDRLLGEQRQTEVQKILALVNLNAEPANEIPSKLGHPWSGNSSRGHVTTGVFQNPHIAHHHLSKHEIATIEICAEPIYRYIGWHPIGRYTRRMKAVTMIKFRIGFQFIRVFRRLRKSVAELKVYLLRGKQEEA